LIDSTSTTIIKLKGTTFMSYVTILGLALGAISVCIALFQLHANKQHRAKWFFILATVLVIGVLSWQYSPDLSFRNFRADKPSATPENVKQPKPTPTPAQATDNSHPDNALLGVRCEPEWVPAWNYTDTKLKEINMWVEGVVVAPESITIHIAAKTWTNYTEATLKNASGAYIIDDQGHAYNRQSKGIIDKIFGPDQDVRPGVIERDELAFPATTPTDTLTLYHPQFEPIKIYLPWAKGMKATH
jgi:hypothetical protein